MRQVAPSNDRSLEHGPGLAQSDPVSYSEPVAYRSMVDTAVPVPTSNAKAPWDAFSPQDYWSHNYEKVLPEDHEIICRVSSFFIKTFRGRRPVQRAIDVGSGTNLYPALLMLPWAEQILLTDYSQSNIDWLHDQVMNGDGPWTWRPFWQELHSLEGYDRISVPRKQLREACVGDRRHPAIERRSVFELPTAQWQLGTMFFVAESITSKPQEFADAIKCFLGALEPRSPFAAAFMSGSEGYKVGDTLFPAVPVTENDITAHFAELDMSKLNVKMLETAPNVRKGYKGMIVATGITGDH
jgi:hypothetical protein